MIIESRDFNTKNGAACELLLEDKSGQIPVRVWGDKLPSLNHLLYEGNVVLVRGKVVASRGVAINANSIVEAKSEMQQSIDRVVVKHLTPRMIRLLFQVPAGKVPVDFEVSGNYRYRLGMLDITLDFLRRINELDTIR